MFGPYHQLFQATSSTVSRKARVKKFNSKTVFLSENGRVERYGRHHIIYVFNILPIRRGPSGKSQHRVLTILLYVCARAYRRQRVH